MMGGHTGRSAGRGMRGYGTDDPATCPYFNQAAQKKRDVFPKRGMVHHASFGFPH